MKNNILNILNLLLVAFTLSGCDNRTSNTTDNSSFDQTSDSIFDFSIGTDTMCSSSHSLVGSSANLTTLQHGVSGTVTVIDDCTIEFTNFSYDGGGPSVYIYTGVNGSFTGSNANQISATLTGVAFSNNTLRFVLPASVTLDDFDSISVWCLAFNTSFGEVVF